MLWSLVAYLMVNSCVFGFEGSSSWSYQCGDVQIDKGMDPVGHSSSSWLCILRYLLWHRRESWVYSKYALSWDQIKSFEPFPHCCIQQLNDFLCCNIAGVEAKLDKEAKIIVACSSAGTMKPTQNLPEGQQSRYCNIKKSCNSCVICLSAYMNTVLAGLS